MKAVKGLFAVAALMMVLSACGLIGGIIGPQPITDPLGVDKLDTASVDIGSVSPTAIGTLASFGSETVSATFDDIDPVDLRGFTPNQIVEKVGLTNTVTVSTADASTLPENFTLSGLTLDFILFDVSDPAGVTPDSVTFDGSLAYAKDAASCTATDCSYTLTGNDIDLSALWTVVVSNAAKAYALVTSGGMNTVQATLSLTTNSTPELAGSTITFDLQAGAATISVH
ncbi:MAG TPA: hypothetical protein VF171_04890 [Trueperaceae bacterium]